MTKYGKLEPLAEIDLRPRCRARVEVHCEEKVEQVRTCLHVQATGSLAWGALITLAWGVLIGYQASMVAGRLP